MRKQKAYTWVELLIVLLIISILSAIGIPILRGRINAAKWSEGRAIAGGIAVAIQTWNAGENMKGTWNENTLTPSVLGISVSDLSGTYFIQSNFSWQVAFDGTKLTYVVTITPPSEIGYPAQVTLDSSGGWGN